MKLKFSKKEIIIITILSIIIISISIPVILKKELLIDKIGYSIIVESLRQFNLDKIMIIITSLSNTITIIGTTIIFTLAFLLFFKNQKEALCIPLNVIAITLINQIIKRTIKRPRPSGFRLIKQGGYSFPSGHSMVSMAFYGLIIYIINKKIKNKNLRIVLITLVSLLIILVGISRIYLGVHYLSDVIVGYSISIIYLIVISKILKRENLFP